MDPVRAAAAEPLVMEMRREPKTYAGYPIEPLTNGKMCEILDREVTRISAVFEKAARLAADSVRPYVDKSAAPLSFVDHLNLCCAKCSCEDMTRINPDTKKKEYRIVNWKTCVGVELITGGGPATTVALSTIFGGSAGLMLSGMACCQIGGIAQVLTPIIAGLIDNCLASSASEACEKVRDVAIAKIQELKTSLSTHQTLALQLHTLIPALQWPVTAETREEMLSQMPRSQVFQLKQTMGKDCFTAFISDAMSFEEQSALAFFENPNTENNQAKLLIQYSSHLQKDEALFKSFICALDLKHFSQVQNTLNSIARSCGKTEEFVTSIRASNAIELCIQSKSSKRNVKVNPDLLQRTEQLRALQNQVSVKDDEIDAFVLLLQYLQTDQLQFTLENVRPVLALAQRFGLKECQLPAYRFLMQHTGAALLESFEVAAAYEVQEALLYITDQLSKNETWMWNFNLLKWVFACRLPELQQKARDVLFAAVVENVQDCKVLELCWPIEGLRSEVEERFIKVLHPDIFKEVWIYAKEQKSQILIDACQNYYRDAADNTALTNRWRAGALPDPFVQVLISRLNITS